MLSAERGDRYPMKWALAQDYESLSRRSKRARRLLNPPRWCAMRTSESAEPTMRRKVGCLSRSCGVGMPGDHSFPGGKRMRSERGCCDYGFGQAGRLEELKCCCACFTSQRSNASTAKCSDARTMPSKNARHQSTVSRFSRSARWRDECAGAFLGDSARGRSGGARIHRRSCAG